MRYAMLLFVVLATLAGCASTSPGQPAATTPAALITMPDIIGENVAVDTLEALGFTDIDLGTTDGHRMIILPQNWTVTTQSAKPASDSGPTRRSCWAAPASAQPGQPSRGRPPGHRSPTAPGQRP